MFGDPDDVTGSEFEEVGFQFAIELILLGEEFGVDGDNFLVKLFFLIRVATGTSSPRGWLVRFGFNQIEHFGHSPTCSTRFFKRFIDLGFDAPLFVLVDLVKLVNNLVLVGIVVFFNFLGGSRENRSCLLAHHISSPVEEGRHVIDRGRGRSRCGNDRFGFRFQGLDNGNFRLRRRLGLGLDIGAWKFGSDDRLGLDDRRLRRRRRSCWGTSTMRHRRGGMLISWDGLGGNQKKHHDHHEGHP